MNTVVEFKKAHNTIKGEIICKPNRLIESIGPNNNETLCLFSTEKSTAPHIDLFETTSEYGNIIISGNTGEYTIQIPTGSNEQDAIEQYFLENPTRQGSIQYLSRVINNDDYIHHLHYNFFVPGLIYDDISGKILGFLHSYVTNGSSVEFEIPYNSTEEYHFSGATATKKSGEENVYLLTISGNHSDVTVTAGDAEAEFNLYKNMSSEFRTFTIKTLNEYVDYTIAAQILDNPNIINIKDYFEAMEQVPSDLNAWHPVHFKSVYLWSFAETARNITPNIYKVPLAFVTNVNKKVFMINVTGISANELK